MNFYKSKELISQMEATRLNKGFAIIAVLALSAAFINPSAEAQSKSRKKPVKKKASASRPSGPETGLLGISLFDNALRVLTLYGNPDQIQPISTGGTSGGGGGFGGGAGGGGGKPSFGGGPGGGGGAPRGGGGPGSPVADPFFPFDPSQDPMGIRQQAAPGGMGMPSAPSSGGPGGPGGAPAGFGGPGGAPGGIGGPGASSGGSSDSTEYTRWVYTRSGSKFGFIVDKFNRVIQIEAIGLQNARVKTKRGIGFGSTFTQVMNSYAKNPPDGYDINGTTVTVRFLTRDKVAFRITQLGNKKTHVVTAMVVAAGKQ